MTVARRQVEELIIRLNASVGEAVFEDVTAPDWAPEPRESWIDLQAEVVARAEGADPAAQRDLAAALLNAVLHQPSFGPSNRLSADAFALLLAAVPDDLAASLVFSAGHMYGGQRHLRQHLFSLPGPEGARWLGVLARADDVGANFLLQDLASGKLPRWPDEDWADRLDAMAELPSEPRPGIVRMLFLVRPPRAALPAFVRLAMAHGTHERDPLVRHCAQCLREQRASVDDAVDLIDWDARDRRPELFRWLLELSGEAGERPELVGVAVRAGMLPEDDALSLSAPLDRPAWADGEVPWEVESTAVAGELRLPEGKVTGGDPWWTNALEGFPWTIDVPQGSYPIHVVVAGHPLAGSECAALEMLLDDEAPVEQWRLVPSGRNELVGYHVEVGVASFGAPAVYDSAVALEDTDDFFARPHPAWATADGGAAGTIVYCTVGPQHQLCRTWLGTASGRLVAVVTDLGLLGLDLAENPARPWRR